MWKLGKFWREFEWARLAGLESFVKPPDLGPLYTTGGGLGPHPQGVGVSVNLLTRDGRLTGEILGGIVRNPENWRAMSNDRPEPKLVPKCDCGREGLFQHPRGKWMCMSCAWSYLNNDRD